MHIAYNAIYKYACMYIDICSTLCFYIVCMIWRILYCMFLYIYYISLYVCCFSLIMTRKNCLLGYYFQDRDADRETHTLKFL